VNDGKIDDHQQIPLEKNMSPHFGLMDETGMSREEALLMRAKLHWRAGVRRMRVKKIPAGLTTLYDALLSAMRWYILLNRRDDLGDDAGEQLENERYVFSLLRKAGVLDGSIDIHGIEVIVDRALMGDEVDREDQEKVLAQFGEILTRIGILPFDQLELPPEDPSTF
jgi:hypothetical protein